MNLPLLSPGMCVLIIVCACMMLTAAITLYLIRHKFKSPKNRKRSAIFALSVFGLIIAYILFYTVSNMIGRVQVQAQLAKMREQKVLFNQDDVCPQVFDNNQYMADKHAAIPQIPDGNNGARFYKSAFELINGSSSYSSLFDMMVEQPTFDVFNWPEQARNTAQQLLKNQDIELILNLFRQGAEKTYAVYKRNYKGTDTSLPELKIQRPLFRLISIKSSCDGLNGNPEAGYNLLRDGFKMIIQLQTEKIVLSQLVNIACVAVNLDAVNTLLSRYGITSSSARLLLAELEKIDFKQAMMHGIDGEIVMCREDIFEKVNRIDSNISKLDDRVKGNTILYVSWIWPFLYQDYAYYLAKMEIIKGLYGKPYWAEANELKELDRECRHPGYRIITGFLTSSLLPQRTKVARIESDIDAAKLTLALHIYKNEHGAFPDKLEQLAPEIIKAIPVDPISGKPFEYQKTDGKFTLSSVWLKEKEEMQKKQAKQPQSAKRNLAKPK